MTLPMIQLEVLAAVYGGKDQPGSDASWRDVGASYTKACVGMGAMGAMFSNGTGWKGRLVGLVGGCLFGAGQQIMEDGTDLIFAKPDSATKGQPPVE